MKSRTTERFRLAFSQLPAPIQRQAKNAYKLFQQDTNHPGLNFKRIHATRPIYSVRISLGYRAIGVREEDVIIWFWIGSHSDYDKLIVRLAKRPSVSIQETQESYSTESHPGQTIKTDMNIVITGSVAFDYLMKFPGYFRDHFLPDKLDHVSLSFLVEEMTRWRGGCAPNIAYTLALLGERPVIMATVGEDFEEYRAFLESMGIDTSGMRVVPGVFTASFFCNTDRANAQIASFYPGAMGYSGQLSFAELPSRPDLALISPTDPAAMTQYAAECRNLGIPYVYDPSQQLARLSADDVRQGIEGALALFVNDYEAGLIERATGLTPADIQKYVKFLVITCGELGANVYADGQRFDIPIVPPVCIEDPTGVGDAFRGGFLTGYAHGWGWELCGRMGALAATYCLEQRGPQSHHYTPAEFIARFRKHFDDSGQLEALLESKKVKK